MSQEIINEFGRMNQLLRKMEAEHRVDASILNNISRLKSEFSILENKMTENKSENVKSRFLSYHIFRNISLILSKMEQRFLIAPKVNDNPVVAEDSISLLATLTQSANVAFKYGGKHLTKREEEEMLYCIQTLRNDASAVSMLIKPEEELGNISLDDLNKEAKIIADSVEQSYRKKESIRRN